MKLELEVMKIVSRTFNTSIRRLTLDTTIRRDLKGDEWDTAEIVYELAEQLGKPVRSIMTRKLHTINDLCQYAATYFGATYN